MNTNNNKIYMENKSEIVKFEKLIIEGKQIKSVSKKSIDNKTLYTVERNIDHGFIEYLDINGFEYVKEYDENNNEISYEDSDETYYVKTYDENNNEISHNETNHNTNREHSYIKKYYNNNSQMICEYSNGYSYTKYFDKNYNDISSIDSEGDSYTYSYDENNNEIRFEDSTGYYHDKTYDNRNNEITFKDSFGYSYTKTYDENNNLIKFEDSLYNIYTYEYVYFKDYYDNEAAILREAAIEVIKLRLSIKRKPLVSEDEQLNVCCNTYNKLVNRLNHIHSYIDVDKLADNEDLFYLFEDINEYFVMAGISIEHEGDAYSINSYLSNLSLLLEDFERFYSDHVSDKSKYINVKEIIDRNPDCIVIVKDDNIINSPSGQAACAKSKEVREEGDKNERAIH